MDIDFLEVLKWILSAGGALGGLWVSLGKKYRGLIIAWFKNKEAKLSFEERYERFQDARLEKLLNTVRHYESLNDELDQIARDKQVIVDDFVKSNSVLKVQFRDQARIIEKYKSAIEENKNQLNDAHNLLRRFRSYIKRLELLLRANNVEFEQMDIDL